jgi:quercetin dioxygenase-like cupin family protein
MRIRLAVFALILFGWAVLPATDAAEAPDKAKMAIYLADEIKWVEAPPSLPKGATVAVLEGDPTKEGPFTMRAKMPDGYRVPPHTHPQTERVTVISGTLHIGMSEKFDEKSTKAMPAGSFGYWPAGMKHFAYVKGETIIQLNGIGPWAINYLNPEDDPRDKK